MGGGGVTSTEEKERVVEEYFQRLYTTTNSNGMKAVLDKVDWVVTPAMNQTLLQLYSPDEIKRALFPMHPSKSPTLDDMSPFFFKKIFE